jgi:hypothetical protein
MRGFACYGLAPDHADAVRSRAIFADKMLPGHRNLSTIPAMQEPSGSPAHAAARSGSTAEVFAAFLRLGLTSFGGPIAHLGYFHEEFVVRRKWLDEKTYVDLVALSQFLPGPASSKVGIALGLSPAMRGRSPPGPASRCRRRSRWCCSAMASRRSAMRSAAVGCMGSKSRPLPWWRKRC